MMTPAMINPVTLAQSLIRCPSVTPEEGGALTLLEEVLKPLGFTCHRLRFEEAGTEPVENLYARWGSTAPNLCFAGHTDVVPPGNEADWTYPPFAAEIHNGVLYGRGAEDMKGAIAAFIAAASRFIEVQGKNGKGSISLLITGDEEGPAINGTRKMLGWLKEQGEVLDACIVGEPTNPKTIGEMAKIGRRGSIGFHLTVHGRQGHVAYQHLADNPITRLVPILNDLKAEPIDGGTDYFPPTNLEITTVDVGNPAVNVIPGEARASFNIRFNDLQDGEALASWVREVCARHAENITLDYRCSAEAFLTPPGPLSDIVKQSVQAVTGKEPDLTTTGGTSDARFIKDACPVVEFGTTGKRAHQVDECVKVVDIECLSAIYGEVLSRYF